MNNIGKYAIAISFILISIKAFTQTSPIRPLKAGDIVPDVPLTVCSGEANQTIHLRNKLTLIDFWNIRCSGCIAAMPEMEELQKTFGDSINIIAVTADDEKSVKQLFHKLGASSVGKHDIESLGRLRMIVGDTILSKIFPHWGDPTHVWIDADGRYLAMTYSATTTAESIRMLLSGRKPFLALRRTDEDQFDIDDPVSWIGKKGYDTTVAFNYSFFTHRIEKGIDGSGSRVFFDSTTKRIIGLCCPNLSIAGLFKIAFFGYEEGRAMSDERVMFENKNMRVSPPPNWKEYFQWADSNTFCYAMRVPPGDDSSFYAYMKADLFRYLHLKGKIEKRNVDCIVFNAASAAQSSSKALKPTVDEIVFSDNKYKRILRNMPVSQLADIIANAVGIQFPGHAFIKENTGKGVVNIDLPWSTYEADIPFAELVTTLQKQGISLGWKKRESEMLVIF